MRFRTPSADTHKKISRTHPHRHRHRHRHRCYLLLRSLSPTHSPSHTFHANLSPPGTQSSLFGMLTFPDHLPHLYILPAIDFLNSGGPTAARDERGYAGRFRSAGVSPRWWMRSLFGKEQPSPGGVGGLRRGPVQVHEGFGGVHVMPPRTTLLRTSGQTMTGVTEYGPSVRIWKAVGE